MANETGQLRAKDELLAAALARGSTVRAAAKAAGYSERHGHRRAADPDVVARAAEMRSEFVGRTVDGLRAAGVDAVETLRCLLADGTPAAVRLSAAKAIVELGAKLRETEEIEARLTYLENLHGS